jgi:CheY-like chemotaxis protein
MNNKKILIVDNEPDNTSVFSLALEAEGFKALPKSILQKYKKSGGDMPKTYFHS